VARVGGSFRRSRSSSLGIERDKKRVRWRISFDDCHVFNSPGGRKVDHNQLALRRLKDGFVGIQIFKIADHCCDVCFVVVRLLFGISFALTEMFNFFYDTVVAWVRSPERCGRTNGIFSVRFFWLVGFFTTFWWDQTISSVYHRIINLVTSLALGRNLEGVSRGFPSRSSGR